MGNLIVRVLRIGFLALPAIVCLGACATQATPGAAEPPGFWLGLVHGFISPFALVAELFADVRVYAVPNSGGSYDLGFMLGAAAILGGGGISVKISR